MQERLLSWFWEGGSVSVPKRLFALMGPLHLSFEDLGQLLYLLSLEGKVDPSDRMGRQAAEQLAGKGFVGWQGATGLLDYEPLIGRVVEATGLGEKAETQRAQPLPIAYANLIKRFEREQGRFLSPKEKEDLTKALQQFGWSEDLLYEIYSFYLKNHRRRNYDFLFFAQMAYSGKVKDTESFQTFCANLDRDSRKVREVLRRLGKYNNPSEAQKEMYGKWHHTWRFSHEMILLATEDTVSADNPSFGYLDQILAQWNEEGLKNPEDVRKHREKRAAARRIVRGQGKNTGKLLRNRHAAAEGPRDFSHLEE